MEDEVKKKRMLIIGILLIIAIVAMLIVNIVLVVTQNEQKDKQGNLSEEEENTSSQTEQAKKELGTLDEYSRIVTYFDQYISAIEDGKYEEAYNMLYSEFKENYYPTLDKYKEYVQKKYPVVMSVKYNGVERAGEYYIMDIEVIDTIRITAEERPSFTQKFIIYEKDLADFVLSFQAE